MPHDTLVAEWAETAPDRYFPGDGLGLTEEGLADLDRFLEARHQVPTTGDADGTPGF